MNGGRMQKHWLMKSLRALPCFFGRLCSLLIFPGFYFKETNPAKKNESSGPLRLCRHILIYGDRVVDFWCFPLRLCHWPWCTIDSFFWIKRQWLFHPSVYFNVVCLFDFVVFDIFDLMQHWIQGRPHNFQKKMSPLRVLDEMLDLQSFVLAMLLLGFAISSFVRGTVENGPRWSHINQLQSWNYEQQKTNTKQIK